MPSPDDYAKQAQRLSREWKRGNLTTEQFQIESLKLAVDLKEMQYLRAASQLLDAKKLLLALAQVVHATGVPSDPDMLEVVMRVDTFLKELDKE